MTGAQAAGFSGREADSGAASAVKALQAEGRHAEARERYAELVGRHQRRASRIAFHYMRDVAEADEAVQDAFVKAFSHLSSFREELRFEVWFTRIPITGCPDRIKARTRRERWISRCRTGRPGNGISASAAGTTSSGGSVARARTAERLAQALVISAPALVVMLSHYGDAPARVSADRLERINRAVHLFPSSCGRCWSTVARGDESGETTSILTD
jgi:RNA polymerase sigma-70 factor (ECF subfamily)